MLPVLVPLPRTRRVPRRGLPAPAPAGAAPRAEGAKGFLFPAVTFITSTLGGSMRRFQLRSCVRDNTFPGKVLINILGVWMFNAPLGDGDGGMGSEGGDRRGEGSGARGGGGGAVTGGRKKEKEVVAAN